MKFTELLKQMPDFIGGNGCSDEKIAAYEKELGCIFAPDYREYLLEIGLASFDSRELTGISKSSRLNVVDVTKEERGMNDKIPSGLYVIEETGYDGMVIWQDKTGVVYATMPYQKPEKICGSLTEYLQK